MPVPTTDDALATIGDTVVIDPSDGDTVAAVLARTYEHTDDPAAVVDLYRDYQQAREEFPDAGSSKLASELGVPRSRIRRWSDTGAVPYVVQGLRTVDERDWLPAEYDTDTFRALNELAAWVLASGSIHVDKWTVRVIVDDDDRDRLATVLDPLGLETEIVERYDASSMVKLTPDGSVLGRVLHSLGVPIGEAPDSLPPYLDDAPRHIREAWLDTFLRESSRADGSIPSNDAPDGLGELLEDVTGVATAIKDGAVIVPEEAMDALALAARRHQHRRESVDPLPLLTERALASTYAQAGDDSPYEMVQQFQTFTEADGFWTNVAREYDIPMSRAQRWHNGGEPDASGAVSLATSNGWTADEWTSTVEAIAELTLGVIANGSVNHNHIPKWSVHDGEPASRIEAALETIGVGAADRDGQIVPAEQPVAVGRALTVVGAPVDERAAKLPDWVYHSPNRLQERWLWMLVFAGGTPFKPRGPSRKVSGSNPQSYFVDLARLIEDVTGEQAAVHDGRITVPADAVRQLRSSDGDESP